MVDESVIPHPLPFQPNSFSPPSRVIYPPTFCLAHASSWAFPPFATTSLNHVHFETMAPSCRAFSPVCKTSVSILSPNPFSRTSFQIFISFSARIYKWSHSLLFSYPFFLGKFFCPFVFFFILHFGTFLPNFRNPASLIFLRFLSLYCL